LVSEFSIAQNLAPNASFEEVNFVDNIWSKTFEDFESKITEWTSPNQGSPDIMDNKDLAVMERPRPGLRLTDVKARTGSKSIGLKTYGCENRVMHCREYVQVKLNQQVPMGDCITYDYWVCRTSTSILSNNFGAALSDTLIWQAGNRKELDVPFPTHGAEMMGEVPGEWYHVSGEILAHKNCDYFLIGNFLADRDTKTIVPESALNYAFYLIDDVSVFLKDCSDTLLNSHKLTLDNVMFKFDSWEITENGRATIKHFLSQVEEQIHGLRIVGHTDGVGAEAYNLQLSAKRASAVKDVFVELGVPEDVILYEGVGTQDLIAEPASAENRRVEITIE